MTYISADIIRYISLATNFQLELHLSGSQPSAYLSVSYCEILSPQYTLVHLMYTPWSIHKTWL